MKAYARPFEDKPEDIVKRALDAFDELSGRKSAKPEDIVKPALDALDEQSGPKMAKPVPVYSRKVMGGSCPRGSFASRC